MQSAAKAITPATAPSRYRLLKKPIDLSDARRVRTAKAVPICPAIIPMKDIVVACRYAW